MKSIYILVVITTIITILYLIYPRSKPSTENTYDLHVYPWGAQIAIRDITTPNWTGDVVDNEFKWERKPQKYSGFYQLDTGSHLLTDLIMMDRKSVLDVVNNHNIKHDDLHQSGYAYLQGGTPPINIYQDVRIDKKQIRNVPVGLMALNDQGNMLKEREIVNGVFGLSHIGKNHPLKPYSIVDKLLEDCSNRTIFIDFKNEKMTCGLSKSPDSMQFRGKIDTPENIMRMDVWVQDDRGGEYKMLVDTGTLYSQFKYPGECKLKGVRGSKGLLVMKNAKLLPPRLVGNGKPVILGYNDLYRGSMFIDFDSNRLDINQNY